MSSLPLTLFFYRHYVVIVRPALKTQTGYTLRHTSRQRDFPCGKITRRPKTPSPFGFLLKFQSFFSTQFCTPMPQRDHHINLSLVEDGGSNFLLTISGIFLLLDNYRVMVLHYCYNECESGESIEGKEISVICYTFIESCEEKSFYFPPCSMIPFLFIYSTTYHQKTFSSTHSLISQFVWRKGASEMNVGGLYRNMRTSPYHSSLSACITSTV